MISEWPILPFSELAEMITDGAHESPPSVLTGGVPMASVKDMRERKISVETCRRISTQDANRLGELNCIPQKGDLLIAKDGSILKHIIVFDQPERIVLLSSIALVRFNDSIDPYFAKCYLEDPRIVHFFIGGYTGGSAIPRFVLKEFKKFPIHVPPLDVQRFIVRMIKSLDYAITKNDSIVDCISELINSQFHSWFIDFDPVKAKAEDKLPHGMDEETAALFPNSFEDSELGPIPTGWRVSSISEICKMSSGGTPSRSKEEYFSESSEGYPWLASRELNGNIIHDAEEYISELGLKNSSAKLFPQNSVAMAMYGATAGRIGYFAKPLTTSQAICVMVAKENICLPKYLYFLLESESWKIVWMNATGGAQPNISQQIIAKHRIVLPPLEIIQKLESLVDELFANIDTSTIQSEKLSEIRDALLPKLMSGELKVN